MKSTTIFFCSSCGNEFAKWAGQCPACHEWNTLTEAAPLLKAPKSGKSGSSSLKPAESFSIQSALTSEKSHTFSTNIGELDRVLGLGITRGGVYLLAGQPGIGKSTLLTQLAITLSKPPLPAPRSLGEVGSKGETAQPKWIKNQEPRTNNSVLYVCSEENPAQVATRLQRLSRSNCGQARISRLAEPPLPAPRSLGEVGSRGGVRQDGGVQNITLLNTSITEQITEALIRPPLSRGGVRQDGGVQLCIVDSIQSIASAANPTTAGSPSQIRDSATLLIQAAKETNTPLIIVGHVTKEGTIAGPKMLEHMVDVVLELSGDRQHLLRTLRTIKNRFGPTDETGLFRMDSTGLQEVKDPGEILLADRVPNSPGSALTMIMEGTRPLTVEIQALVVSSPLPVPRRIAKGISTNRLQLICAILQKHLNLAIATKDVFVNVTGGIDVKDPNADLGIALAIISSVKDKPLSENSICFGELGLLGEIRKVGYTDKMLKEAKVLGYSTIFSPTNHSIKSLKI